MTGLRPVTGDRPCHWVFDLDGTLVDGLAATRLRPGVTELLSALAARGVRCSLWSAGGSDYAARVAARMGIAHSFGAVGYKAVSADGCWVLPTGWADGVGVVCVDDDPGRLPLGVEVRAVRPWLGAASDTQLLCLARDAACRTRP